MKSSINLAMFLLLAIASSLPAGYCQDVWIILPEESENQIGYLSEPASAIGEPIGFFPSEGRLPSAIAPHIVFFNGPSEAKPGDTITLTWKVWGACSVYLDTNPINAEDSYTYTVPMQGAPHTIYHQLVAYGEPCDNPIRMTKDLYIRIHPLIVPNAPSELGVYWASLDAPIANFQWKDNSNDEYGFKIYNGINLVGSTGSDVTDIEIPLPGSCGQSFSFHATAYNGIGESAPSNSVTIDGLCPPNTLIQNCRINYLGPENTEEHKYFIDTYFTGAWGTGGALFDIHVITESQTGDLIKEELYNDVPSSSRLELKPPCIGSMKVYAIPKNGAGEGNPTNELYYGRSEDDPACTLYYDPTQNIKYASKQFKFSAGPSWGDSDEYYFTVYSPGPISAKATWTGTATDLDLVLEGPNDYGLHAPGPSPRALSHIVTGRDLIEGYTWKISIINHIAGGTATGTIDLTYPEGCSFGGTWDTNFGKMGILLYPDGTFTGNYEHDQGSIEGNIPIDLESSKLSGRWHEIENVGSQFGDFELYMSEDCESFTGNWRYGHTGDWNGDWKGTRSYVGDLDLRPRGHGI